MSFLHIDFTQVLKPFLLCDRTSQFHRVNIMGDDVLVPQKQGEFGPRTLRVRIATTKWRITQKQLY